jgi:plastocyanin
MRALALTLLLCAFAIPVAGCGGDDDDDGGSSGGGSAASGGGGGQTLKIAADPSGASKFNKTSLTAKAGKVTISMDNPSDVDHAVEIEGMGVEADGETVGNGGVSKASAELKPGKYEFYCPVDGHEQAGMKGTLTVN